MKASKQAVSPETQAEAMKIAKATQKPGQTKEQTKLVAQGIEKGIALYKKQQKEKKRQFEKERKKVKKTKQVEVTSEKEAKPVEETTKQSKNSQLLPWVLLLISWLGFIAFITQT